MASETRTTSPIDMGNAVSRMYKANANTKYMGTLLAELVRNLMRASARGDTDQLHKAANNLLDLCRLSNIAEEVTTHDVVWEAMEYLAVSVPSDSLELPSVRLAEHAVQYLLEMSSTDGFACARWSNRSADLREAIEHFAEDCQRQIDRNNALRDV